MKNIIDKNKRNKKEWKIYLIKIKQIKKPTEIYLLK